MTVNIMKFTNERSLNHPPGEITHLVAQIHEQQFSLEQEAEGRATMYFRVGSWIYN